MSKRRNISEGGPELFIEPSGQLRLLDKSVEQVARESRHVECLGLTFKSDEARRAYFLENLREKLRDPDFRQIEGFPAGKDEDILRLSDPPYYTACPNPFIEDFVKHYGKPYDPNTPYSREPFATDVSEGKNDPIYNAHSYHTKVPHKAIMRYILHYTEPGDIISDGFCGTGMTGVAAQLCGDRIAVQELGYKVLTDGTILDEEGKPFSKLGSRHALLADLSPAATFIAYNYNTPVDATEFRREAQRILAEVERECGWMYLTLHQPKPVQVQEAVSLLKPAGLELKAHSMELPWGRINYTVWSDVFVCSECAQEVIFWDVAIDRKTGEVREEFPCPYCNARLTKRSMDRAQVTKFDTALNQTIRQAKQVPVLINYSEDSKRFEKAPDAFDIALVKQIENSTIPSRFPTDRMPEGYNTEQPKVSHGITHAHHFYTRRNLWVFANLYGLIIHPLVRCALLGGYTVGLKTARFLPLRWVNKDTGPMKPHTAGTLYVPSLYGEQNWLNIFAARTVATLRASRFIKDKAKSIVIGCTSSSNLPSQDNSVDYIFTDPPFGGNLMYSELNFLWEAWLRAVCT